MLERPDHLLYESVQTHVDNSFGNSLAFTMNNTYGTHVLLEACHVYGGIRRFVAVSTDEVSNPSAAAKIHRCIHDHLIMQTFSACACDPQVCMLMPLSVSRESFHPRKEGCALQRHIQA